MISIIRVGSNPDVASGSRIVDALNNDFTDIPPVKKFIIIKKIDPEEYEDQGVEDMAKNEEDFELDDKELDDIESEIPPEVDQIADEELDDIDFDDEFDELDGKDISEDDLADIESEIPPEVDELEDNDIEIDDDIDDEKSEDEKKTMTNLKKKMRNLKRRIILMTTSSKIPDKDKINLDEIVSEFIQYINQDSQNLSTDPNVVRVKVIKPDPTDCPSCSRTPVIKSGG